MAHLGVPTTRAVALIASYDDRARRPWYGNTSVVDARFEPVKHGGDVVRLEPTAVASRAARTFVRVGSFELYARRSRRGGAEGRLAARELEALFWYAYDVDFGGSTSDPLDVALKRFAEGTRDRFASLACHWLRVGYAQSNFNSDNCLVSGATIDYGPFGFVERYDPGWGMWIGSGDHFAFGNQLEAAKRNWLSLLDALRVLSPSVTGLQASFDAVAARARGNMWAAKFGVADASALDAARDRDGNVDWGAVRADHAEGDRLWRGAKRLLARPGDPYVDYAIFFRQLSDALRAPTTADALRALEPAWYTPPSPALERDWSAWLADWRANTPAANADAMDRVNPKFVPREWMLVRAYEAAERRDTSVLHTLNRLFLRPYDEQDDLADLYYRRAPDGSHNTGGVGFMS